LFEAVTVTLPDAVPDAGLTANQFNALDTDQAHPGVVVTLRTSAPPGFGNESCVGDTA
jgi:hypothetical protein